MGITGPSAPAYAQILQEEGEKRNFDPVTVIVLVAGESSWRPHVVNYMNCVGLGQICLSNYAYCRNGGLNSDKCQAKKAQLQNGLYNLRQVAGSITAQRKFCNNLTNKRTRKTRNRWRRRLPSYGGYNDRRRGSLKKKRGVWCGQRYNRRNGKWRNVDIPETILKYMRRRKKIINTVRRKMKNRE